MSDPSGETPQYTTMSGCLLRVIWAMIGPAIVMLSSLLIIANKTAYGSWPDFLLFGGALVSVAARFFDPGVVDSNRNDGDIGKVTPRQYSAWLLGAAVIVLVVAHTVANLLH